MTGSLPLSGVTVLALEQAVAAPIATRHLADLGARVIKIERPGVGDFARSYDEAIDGLSSHFVWLNRGKESIELDLREAAGREIFLRLVDLADVVVQNLAPGAVERLGVDAETLRTRKPELVMVNISGYGRGGPRERDKAFDLLVQAEAGLMSTTGTAEMAVKAGFPASDIATGMYALTSVLSALFRRAMKGEGATVDVAMFDSTVEWLGSQLYTYTHTGRLVPRMGAGHATIAPYTVYPTADGELFIGVQNDAGWRTLVSDVLEAPDLALDEALRTNVRRVRNRAECDAAVASLTRRFSTAELRARLAAAGVPAAEMNDLAAVARHPQLEARGRWRQVRTEAGRHDALLPPMTFQDVELSMGDVPALGEHTASILEEVGSPSPSSIALMASSHGTSQDDVSTRCGLAEE